MNHKSRCPLSVLSLAPISAEGTVAAAFRNMVSLAQTAERLGYKRFWIAEHHNIPGVASSATDVLIGHVAQLTSTIRVGSGGVMLPNHAPLVIAETFGTLATLYPGRIDLGLGRAPGADPLTMRALRRDLKSRGEDFPELVEELEAFFASPSPGQPVRAIPGGGVDVPLWILGSSLFSADFAARKGLPYAFAAHFAPAQLMQALEIYRNRFKPSQRLSEPYVIVCVPVVAAATDEDASYLATSLQQKILGLITRNYPKFSPPPVKSMDSLWSPSQKAAVDAFLQESIVGGPERVKELMQSLADRTATNEIMVHTDLHQISDTLYSFEVLANVWA